MKCSRTPRAEKSPGRRTVPKLPLEPKSPPYCDRFAKAEPERSPKQKNHRQMYSVSSSLHGRHSRPPNTSSPAGPCRITNRRLASAATSRMPRPFPIACPEEQRRRYRQNLDRVAEDHQVTPDPARKSARLAYPVRMRLVAPNVGSNPCNRSLKPVLRI